MDSTDEITERGDEYAKRLRVRKKDHNQSFESFSKSLRRRKKIIDALSTKKMSPANGAAKPYKNRAKDESSNYSDTVVEDDLAEKSIGSTLWPESTDHNNSLSSESFSKQPSGLSQSCANVEESLSPTDANFNNIAKPRYSSSQTRRDFLNGLLQSPPEPRSSPPKAEPRVSLGQFFETQSHTEMREANFLSKACEEEFEHYNADVKKVKAEQDYFHSRVLQVLEPEVVHVERKLSNDASRRRASDIKLVQDNFPTAPPLDDTTVTSYVSEDVQELDREIERINLQPHVEVRHPETPKAAIYPSLATMEKRMSDHCTRKLFQDDHVDSKTFDVTMKNDDTIDDATNPAHEINQTFSTPMPMTTSQMNRLNHKDQSTSISFIKRNTSFLFGNVSVPKILRRKPNLESTRKMPSVNRLSPSQNFTTISTLTIPNTPSSPYTQDYYAAKTHQTQEQTETSLPPEINNFLRDALGDDYYSSTVYTSADYMRNRTHSCVNGIDLSSEEVTPRNKQIQSKMPMSEPPRQSTALDRSMSFYRNLTKSFRKKSRKAKEEPKMGQYVIIPDSMNPSVRNDVKKLMELMEIYQTQIYQASKALDLCNSMREFQASSERVELERSLIIANVGRMTARETIHRMISKPNDNSNSFLPATLTIRDLSLQLRQDMMKSKRQSGDCIEWFVIVISEGLTIWATKTVACPISAPRVYFPGKLKIHQLKPDFRLTIRVYSMKMHPIDYEHDDKYHIRRHYNSDLFSRRICPSPQRFLSKCEKRRRAMISPKQFEIKFSGVKESAFTLCGSVEITLYDINLVSPWPLLGVSKDSMLHGTIDMELQCRLKLTVSHAGFITFGDEPGGMIAWSRRWCQLNGGRLMFWNYPQECNKPPIYTINLVNCVSKKIELIDRTCCPRPRTLLLETARRPILSNEDSVIVEYRNSFNVVRNLLSCDTYEEVKEWQTKINLVLSTLQQWDVIKNKSLQISDL